MYKFIIILFIFLFTTPFLFAESEHNSLIEIHFGFFTPNIDEEEGLVGTPYKDIFNRSGLRFGSTYSYEIISHQYFGTLSFLSGAEYFLVSGKGRYENDPTEESEDKTSLSMIPLEVAIVYNIDQLEVLFNFPFVFYAKIGLNYNFWWVTDGSGSTVEYEDGNSYGGKKGWHYGLGLRFLLDFLDPQAAKDFDGQYGVNGSYLFVEYNSSKINDFGGDGFELGSLYWRFGLALQF